MKEKGFFDEVYHHGKTSDDTHKLYKKWAGLYDEEMAKNSYITPQRCATALAKFATDKCKPLLDVGCGTGISGMALKMQGFENIDGSDVNEDMIYQARLKQNLYRSVLLVDITNPFPFKKGAYDYISAMGVIAASHAPAHTISDIVDKLDTGGIFTFSLNDHTLSDPTYEAEIEKNVAAGKATILLKEYGEHMRAINMKSNIYVLERI